MERLIKAERKNEELRETIDAVSSSQEHLKDKKIIDLAKKNRNLQMQVESLKTKCAKAAEIAVNLSKEKQEETTMVLPKIQASPNKSLPPTVE